MIEFLVLKSNAVIVLVRSIGKQFAIFFYATTTTKKQLVFYVNLYLLEPCMLIRENLLGKMTNQLRSSWDDFSSTFPNYQMSRETFTASCDRDVNCCMLMILCYVESSRLQDYDFKTSDEVLEISGRTGNYRGNYNWQIGKFVFWQFYWLFVGMSSVRRG